MKLTLEDGSVLKCADKPFKEGATGLLYRVPGADLVVKLYKDPSDAVRASAMAAVHEFGYVADPPYWSKYFRWPSAIVKSPKLGVLMPALPKGFLPLAHHVLAGSYNHQPRREKSWLLRALWALRLARAICRMHRNGIAHGDLSATNIQISLDGRVMVIDTDAPVVPSVLPAQVLGTLHYMPPELLAGTAMPSIRTDLHELAVPLHELLLFMHPLIGPKIHSVDPDEDDRLVLGARALYIGHPTDRSNQPKRFWPARILGGEIERLFQAAFVSGLKHPEARPTAGAWEEALVRLLDRVVPCANAACDQQFFPASPGEHLKCPWCGTSWSARASLPWFSVEPIHQAARRGLWWVAGSHGRTFHDWHRRTVVMPGPDAPVEPFGSIAVAHASWMFSAARPGISLLRSGNVPVPIPVGAAIPVADGQLFSLGNDADLRLRVKL